MLASDVGNWMLFNNPQDRPVGRSPLTPTVQGDSLGSTDREDKRKHKSVMAIKNPRELVVKLFAAGDSRRVVFLLSRSSAWGREVMATSASNAGAAFEQAKIAAVRQTWMQAVRDGDANRLTEFVTDDVVAVLKDGRCVCGKESLKAVFQHVFGLYDVERSILSSRVMTRDAWAIELDELDSTMTPVNNERDIHAHVKTVVVFGRQSDGEWKIARLMELLD